MASSAAKLLWQAYGEADVAARQALIEHYLPLVKRVCGRLSINLPNHIDREDLESAGILGLMDAIANFCPDRGVKFETYAVARIRGAAIDSLRQSDFVPRSVRQKAKQLQDVIHNLQGRLGYTPSDEQIAEELGLSMQDLSKWWQDVQSISVLSLNVPLDKDEDGADLTSLLVAPSDSDPVGALLQIEGTAELAAAITTLTEREQLLLSLYYEAGLTLKELGQVLGVSESRCSQIHTAVMLKLRAKLA